MLLTAAALGETVVLMERFDFEGMLRVVEKYKVNYMPVSPPLIVAFVKSELTKKYDLSSLLLLGCGGAPLGKEVADRFKEKFPQVEIVQGYGLTETGGGATRMTDPEGYVGDEKATAETLDSEGWLKTGDLCYFDFQGFLYIVDRLKELIKYKGYQVPPVELEQLLQSNPEIADAAVIPEELTGPVFHCRLVLSGSRYPDEEAGQIPWPM
ncbi:hypothetical protein GH714_000487 [Hevea brasiliensis]|uniref:AMP-dependent synthetase/ligase domain-containing protein n=1 Tax=Hevea brasiliensis TaxID=3981 RepID=A0A6A6LMG6_HEVBR|nr:hypothetical protein GH714_000487 [Hevea brasiliensis]